MVRVTVRLELGLGLGLASLSSAHHESFQECQTVATEIQRKYGAYLRRSAVSGGMEQARKQVCEPVNKLNRTDSHIQATLT